MIRVAVGEKNIHHIEDCTTAKEAWNNLTEVFVGNESMRRNRYEAMSNQIEGFYKKDDETHEEMYQRLKALASAYRDLGAKHVDDTYIKRKYVNALMPFEENDLNSLQGKHNYDLLTSNEVMQEMQSYKVRAQIARDSRARALGMAQSSSLALKAKVVELDEDQDHEEGSYLAPEELKGAHRDYVALMAKDFWKNPSKAKAYVDKKHKARGYKEGNPKMKTCFNCQDQFHYVAKCPYKNREEHGGRLIRKEASSSSPTKPYFKKFNPNKKLPSKVLVVREEYMSGDESDEEETTTSEVAALAIASSTTPSLFESPNDNVTTKSATCLMAKLSEVSPSLPPKTMNEMHEFMSLRVKEENVALDFLMTNLQGESKIRLEILMSQYGIAQDLLKEKGRLEREYANEIASLTEAIEEEHELRVSLEEKLENLDESQNETLSKIIKERDHAIAKYNVLEKQKVVFGVGHNRLADELGSLTKAHKALESEHSILTKSFEQLQIQSTKIDEPSSSTCSCDHANIIEENARLKNELAKASSPQGEKPLYELLQAQKPHIGKEGLGYVAKKKKKNTNKKNAKPAQAKETTIASGDATRGNATHNDFAGKYNPSYVLMKSIDGCVFAKYVGTSYGDDYHYAIWVPKTLVTNKRGPISQWVPKTKT